MKRKLLALVCAAVLLAQTAALPVQAAANVYFTAVNETLLELSDSTMPFWSGGYLYVSSGMFSNKELGLSYCNNTTQNTVTVYTTSRALIFYLGTGVVADGHGDTYAPSAIVKGSVIFLPVALIAGFFNLTYTNKKVDHGYLIRLRSSSSVLSDSMFLDAGSSQLASRYSQYTKSKEPAAQETPAVQPSTEEPAQNGRQSIYLCLRLSDASAETLLELLDSANAYATFYVTEQQIQDSGDLLRRITADGHAIGLTADVSDARPVSEQLRSANRALFEAVGQKTRLCVVDHASKADLAAAVDAGYCCLDPDLDRSAYGLRSSSNANYLFSRISTHSGSVVVWLSDLVTAAGLRPLLSSAAEAKDTLLCMTEIV